MLRRAKIWLLLALGLLIGFAYGLDQLLSLRFESGDIYVPYSTLRADPLGLKAYYDALNESPGLQVRRNYRPIGTLRQAMPDSLFYIGTSHQAAFSERELADLEAMVHGQGLRVVFSFLPVTGSEFKAEKKLEKEKAETKAKKSEPPSKAARKKHAEEEPISFARVAGRWGFGFGAAKEAEKFAKLESEAPAQLESEVPWRSALCFRELGPEWRTLYRQNGEPVLIERAYGKGRLVLIADSYFLSNEALRVDRPAQLLSWIAGTGSILIFDEESHGLSDSKGVVSLFKKYGLQGTLSGFLLLGVLFIWRNARPLVPLREAERTESVVTGRGAEEGMINLLRRSVPRSELFAVCLREWGRSASDRDRQILEKLLQESGSEKRPDVLYQAAVTALAEAKSTHLKTTSHAKRP